MQETKLKNLSVKEVVHAQIADAAKLRGMTIQGLTERILRAWLAKNFFAGNVVTNNNGRA